MGVDTAERKQSVDAALVVERDRLTVLEERWAAEGELVASALLICRINCARPAKLAASETDSRCC